MMSERPAWATTASHVSKDKQTSNTHTYTPTSKPPPPPPDTTTTTTTTTTRHHYHYHQTSLPPPQPKPPLLPPPPDTTITTTISNSFMNWSDRLCFLLKFHTRIFLSTSQTFPCYFSKILLNTLLLHTAFSGAWSAAGCGS